MLTKKRNYEHFKGSCYLTLHSEQEGGKKYFVIWYYNHFVLYVVSVYITSKEIKI